MEGSKTETPAMANLNPALPLDVIADILVRLPVKSVGRFRCVSKPWKSLLTSPRFIKDHLNFHMDDPEDIIFTAGPDDSSSPYILTFTPGTSCDGILNKVNCAIEEIASLTVSDSCHGLVLLTDQSLACPKLLMNPITLEAIEVSGDPLPMYDSLSLCYDSSSDDYKIVALSGFENFVDIYSVRAKTWRRIGDCSYRLHMEKCHQAVRPGVFHNGYLHWIAYDHDETSCITRPVILAFSLAAEEFEEVPFPKVMEKQYNMYAKVRSLGGFLALVHHEDCIDVWMMKEYGVQSSWTNPISTRCFVTERCDELYYVVVCLLGEDEVVFDKGIPSLKLVAYNFRNGDLRDLVFAGDIDSHEIHSFVPFKGSLLSPI